jgi:hypothetical protein
MPRYAIAFITAKPSLIHHLVEMDTREAAIRFFFLNHIGDEYSHDDEGYSYFKEDFFHPDAPLGHVLEITTP